MIVYSLHDTDYQWHKNTRFIKVHWNYQRPGNGTIIADGFVEPFDPHNGIHDVELELVGLDEDGKIVNRASGKPADNYIVSPVDKSPFKITLKLTGEEKDFTVIGRFYYYNDNSHPDFSSQHQDCILLDANELL